MKDSVSLPLRPLSELVTPADRPVSVLPGKQYRQLGVRLWGKGAYEREPIQGEHTKYKVLYRLAGGDIVVNKIWARNGSVAVVPPELDSTFGSQEFPAFAPNQELLRPAWFHWITKWPSFWTQCDALSRGSSGKNRIRPERFLLVQVPCPSVDEQDRIAGVLHRLTTRIAEARRLRDELQDEQHEFLLSLARELAANAPREPMQQVAPLVRRSIEVRRDGNYPELGIRSFGKGTFHKPALTGEEVGGKRLYRIEPGDLLFSNVFSWEGAIAVVQPEDAGRYGSHRFITCVPDPAKATADFLCHWFLTEEGMSHIRAASPGAAGRNRTLGIKKLMAIPIPVPPLPAQQRFSEFRHRITQTRALHKDLPAELDAFEKALLDRAFRGQL